LGMIRNGPWELRTAVRQLWKNGAEIVKVMIDGEIISLQGRPGDLGFTDEEVEVIVDEAHRKKMRVACHARSSEAVKQAVRAGIDFIGHANYIDDEALDLLIKNKDKVFIFDTTMRDGEQSPGASMSVEEKIQISRVFDEMGIDIIEAGFPISSPGDFEAVSAISKSVKNSIPCGLARATKKDIDACHESLKFAKRFRIHTFISTSPVHMKHKLNMTNEQVLGAIKESVTYAKKFTDDVEWSCEDGTRTDLDFMYKTIELAIKCGATTINIPDTVGYSIPEEFAKTIKLIKNNVPNIDKAIISAHCHNDLGLAVANALSGLSAGVRQIECTINGIGERAGNAALEEIVMAIKTRDDLLPYETGIKTELISKASKIVSNATGFPVQFNKAIVGKNAFAHESGIHQDGMLKNRETYEIMTPESVGVKKTSLVMGKHSGRHAFKDKLTSLG